MNRSLWQAMSILFRFVGYREEPADSPKTTVLFQVIRGSEILRNELSIKAYLKAAQEANEWAVFRGEPGVRLILGADSKDSVGTLRDLIDGLQRDLKKDFNNVTVLDEPIMKQMNVEEAGVVEKKDVLDVERLADLYGKWVSFHSLSDQSIRFRLFLPHGVVADQVGLEELKGVSDIHKQVVDALQDALKGHYLSIKELTHVIQVSAFLARFA
jgi:hypothetical protein